MSATETVVQSEKSFEEGTSVANLKKELNNNGSSKSSGESKANGKGAGNGHTHADDKVLSAIDFECWLIDWLWELSDSRLLDCLIDRIAYPSGDWLICSFVESID